MAHSINDKCIGCSFCESKCRYEAIRESITRFVIDREKCSDCGKCVKVCPVDAIDYEGKEY